VLLGRASGGVSDRELTIYKAMGHVVEDSPPRRRSRPMQG
jgi:hypothetical protein